ncbi:MAG: hypothetical protein SGJ07_15705 [Rhodospirillaceae bacterium]|nr:hypothetical protein [Rhodospirillaceae bacterium]
MRRICRKLAGSTAMVALLSVSGWALAQDADEPAAAQDSAPMMSQDPMAGSSGYCMPGCIVPPMSGQGMMNQGQMPMAGQGMMGAGMMHQGQMPMMGMAMMHHEPMAMMNDAAMMAPGMGHFLARDLTVDDARHLMEHRLVAFGLPNLKVEAVEETDDDTIIVDVVTKDGVPVQRLSIDRHTGRAVPIE